MISALKITDIDSQHIVEALFRDNFKSISIKDDFLNNPFTKYLVYKEKNKVLAYLNYTVIYDRIEIININVLEEYKNRKIGRKLLAYLIAIAEQENIKNITLEVKTDNDIAIYLYKQYGFKEIAIRKGYYQGIDGILMEKEMIK